MRVFRPLILFALFLMFGTAFAQQTKGYNVRPEEGDDTPAVSIVQLIANPEKYDQKRVKIMGYLRLEFEGSAVYLHEEDYKHALYNNSIWINAPKLTQEQIAGLNNRYVLCTATFNARLHGHMGMFSGELSDVQRLEQWR